MAGEVVKNLRDVIYEWSLSKCFYCWEVLVLFCQVNPVKRINGETQSGVEWRNNSSGVNRSLQPELKREVQLVSYTFLFNLSGLNRKVKFWQIPFFHCKNMHCFSHRYLMEVDCSLGQFKSTKLKDKEYTINAQSSAQHCKKERDWCIKFLTFIGRWSSVDLSVWYCISLY